MKRNCVYRKVIALALAIVTIFSISSPVAAAEIKGSGSEGASCFGYTFTERNLGDGRYEMDSYYKGEYQKTYTIEKGNPKIYVEIKGPSAAAEEQTRNVYVIQGVEIQNAQGISPQAERWASLGYINYNNHALAGDIKAYLMTYGTNMHAKREISVKADTPFDDFVATLSSFIISEGVDVILKELGYAVSGTAEGFALSILGNLGVKVLKGIIKTFFTTTVEVVETTWDFKATPNTSGGSTIYLRDLGTTVLFMYEDNIEWDQMEEGFTLSNWKHSGLARLVWEEMYPSYNYPGVKSYTST